MAMETLTRLSLHKKRGPDRSGPVSGEREVRLYFGAGSVESARSSDFCSA